ncbi:hypothetical protein [Flavihumibacter sp. UBA7668]|uniref:hypothetical protein n=1 Tax=Flavihumibacter sp. UBA7668 TaxID=1946542 RepID=UPI0025BF47A2|nr:hypothetical protein [Flavihumibacter sp. UBA7668]
MLKMILYLLFLLFMLPLSVLAQRNSTLYLQGQYNHTIYDATKGNNPWGIGAALQLFIKPTAKLRPTVELSGDLYLADDKVQRLDGNARPLNEISGMVNLFAGGSLHPTKNLFISLTAGPSFLSGQTKFGIKPFLGIFLTSSQSCLAKLSYINISDRNKETKEDFGSISFSLGFRLY